MERIRRLPGVNRLSQQRSIRRTSAEKILGLVYGAEVDDESTENLERAADVLRNNPEIACIMAMNHIAYSDPAALVIAHERLIDPNHTRDVYAPASAWHLRNNKMFRLIVRYGGRVVDYDVLPVIQSYMSTTPEKWGYSNYDVFANRKYILRSLKQIKESGKPSSILIAPEGTRSPDGKMKSGDPAVASIINKMSPAVIVPVGITYDDSWRREGLNVRSHMKISAGPHLESPCPRSVTLDDVMRAIADQLPDYMRGESGEK